MRWFVLIFAGVLAACAADDVDGAHLSLRVLSSPPTGGDGPSTIQVEWRGSVVAFDPPAIAAVAWSDSVVVTDLERVAWKLDAQGRRVRLTDHIAVPPVASDDHRALALVLEGHDADHVDLAIAEDRVVRIVVHGLASCAPFRFSPSRDVLVYVAPSAGGVAGLHALALRQAATPVCLSNCALRAGASEGWGGDFVATPAAASLRFEDDAITWDGGPRLSLEAVR